MSLLHALILGTVEGLTEFLPISSTAHLIIVSELLNISQTDFQKFFEVFIQSGAIIAVLLLYFHYILKHTYVYKKVFFSFIPTAIIGFLLYKMIKTIFFNSYILIVTAMLILGVIFLVLEFLIKSNNIKLTKSIKEISILGALIIGLAQSIAVVPGVSRAGIVMVAMMFMGYKRDESAIYSFLLAVPTILSASLYDVYKMRNVVFGLQNNIPFLIIGFVASFITAYFVMRWFIAYLKSNSLVIFGIYRILLAIIVLLII